MTGYLEKGSDFNRLIQRQKEFFEYVNIVSILKLNQLGSQNLRIR